MMGFEVIIRSIFAFLLGVFVGYVFFVKVWLYLIFVMVAIFYYLLIDVRLNLRVFVLLLAMFCFGVWRFSISNAEGDMEYDRLIEGVGCVVREVDVRSDKVKYVLKVEGVEGLILVNGDRYPVYSYGDCLKFSGVLESPGVIERFNYGNYLRRFDIYGVIYRCELSLVESNGSVLKFLFAWKRSFERRINLLFLEPHGSFLSGLLLGSRKGIPAELMESFNRTGLTHIIAISGYNITILVLLVSNLFRGFSKKIKLVVSAGFIVVFVVLVGMSASVVRAGIMGLIALLFLWFQRLYYVGVAMIYTVFVMVLVNPKMLIWDSGFQLSFLATLGIVYLAPVLESYFMWLPERFALRESAVMTISSLLMTLPLILVQFGRLSLISPIANLLVLPFLPLVMAFGFLAVVVSCFSMGLAKVLGFLVFVLLELVVFLVEVLASVPLASVQMPEFPMIFLLLSYLLIFRVLLRSTVRGP